jgi:hypothetical protein
LIIENATPCRLFGRFALPVTAARLGAQQAESCVSVLFLTLLDQFSRTARHLQVMTVIANFLE